MPLPFTEDELLGLPRELKVKLIKDYAGLKSIADPAEQRAKELALVKEVSRNVYDKEALGESQTGRGNLKALGGALAQGATFNMADEVMDVGKSDEDRAKAEGRREAHRARNPALNLIGNVASMAVPAIPLAKGAQLLSRLGGPRVLAMAKKSPTIARLLGLTAEGSAGGAISEYGRDGNVSGGAVAGGALALPTMMMRGGRGALERGLTSIPADVKERVKSRGFGTTSPFREVAPGEVDELQSELLTATRKMAGESGKLSDESRSILRSEGKRVPVKAIEGVKKSRMKQLGGGAGVGEDILEGVRHVNDLKLNLKSRLSQMGEKGKDIPAESLKNIVQELQKVGYKKDLPEDVEKYARALSASLNKLLKSGKWGSEAYKVKMSEIEANMKVLGQYGDIPWLPKEKLPLAQARLGRLFEAAMKGKPQEKAALEAMTKQTGTDFQTKARDLYDRVFLQREIGRGSQFQQVARGVGESTGASPAAMQMLALTRDWAGRRIGGTAYQISGAVKRFAGRIPGGQKMYDAAMDAKDPRRLLQLHTALMQIPGYEDAVEGVNRRTPAAVP